MITNLQPDDDQITLQYAKPALEPGIDMAKLIGTPHLFSRYCDTRAGFIVMPIGTMTLQADGRLTGYSHPNETYWRPYEFGIVDADKGFSFVGDNRFIPSSTWQQTFNEMPIGFYCGDPEIPQKLCLVPHTVTSGPEVINYVVATCLPFYEKIVPKLIKQLTDDGIELSRIKVVVNGCNADDDRVINGVDYAFTTHNAWEMSALYEAPLRWDFDYAFLIHDTSEVYPGFRRRVENFNRHLKWDHLPATAMARCLLGLYSHDFLMRTNSFFKKIDNISKNNGIIAEVAGEFLQRAESVLVMGDPEANGAARQSEWREVADFYNSGTLRVRRVFPSINLHKFTHTDQKHAAKL